MPRKKKNIATLCVEMPLRLIPETARVLESVGRKGSVYCRQSVNDYRFLDATFTMTYHGSKFVRRTSTAFIDTLFKPKYSK